MSSSKESESKQWDVISTEDGSPTLIYQDEKMHSHHGAVQETLYIYGRALEYVLEHNWPLQIFSLGLGLGYNEMLAACVLQKRKYRLDSFESEPALRKAFQSFLMSETSENWLHSTNWMACEHLAKALDIKRDELKEIVQRAYEENQIVLKNELTRDTLFQKKYSVIFYDAFSAKVSPELWEEEFLDHLLERIAGDRCVFTTYASKGGLSRALESHGFTLQKRHGFYDKRECTFAIREQC